LRQHSRARNIGAQEPQPGDRRRDHDCPPSRGGVRKTGVRATDQLGAATSGWSGTGVGMENDLASRTGRHTSELRYRAEDLIYEAWQVAGERRVSLARMALELWPDCADGYMLLAQAASSLEEARETPRRRTRPIAPRSGWCHVP
jgi:hypothetical protein